MFAILALMIATDGSRDIDLDKAIENGELRTNQAVASPLPAGVSVTFKVADWPGIYVQTAQPEDWSGYDALSLDVENPGGEAVEINVRVDDAPDSDGRRNCAYGHATIAAGRRARFLCPVGRQPMDFGIRAFPPPEGAVWMASGGERIDRKHVYKWLVFLSSPVTEHTLVLRGARLESVADTMNAVVDRYGQFTRATWAGKMTSDADLKKAARVEESDLKARPQLAGRDEYGGWSAGPALDATGRFRTAKINGKWWFVTPTGHPFWSAGVDCVGLGESTMISGRERSFTWLPGRDEPLGELWGHTDRVHSGPAKSGDTYDFRGANEERKYGANWRSLALDRALDRLRAWGFNTVGNWSDRRTWELKRVPYVATAGIGGSHMTIHTGNDYWGPMPDVFDPQFAKDVVSSLEQIRVPIGDPWCVGWFVDNELSWAGSGEENGRFGIAYGALREGARSPAKQAFVGMLKEKYGDVSVLNAAWGSQFASWEALAAPVQLTEAGAAKRKDDLIAFVKLYAKNYFKPIVDEIHALDPGALYLGPRFAWYGRDAVEVCAQYADVVSFNVYQRKLDPKAWAWVSQLGKPCIIGEFHFGALDRGMFHPGLVAASDQADRAKMYTEYVESVLDNPSFVGCHWFQYADEPILGRSFDGENYNIGLISVVDNPYPELVSAAKAVNAEVYTRRSAR